MSQEYLTESPTASLPSGDPLDLLTDRQFLVIAAKAARRNMSRIAVTLGISRETLYQDLHAARTALEPCVPTTPGPPRCQRCRREPRLPGRTIGQRCRRAQQLAWEHRRDHRAR